MDNDFNVSEVDDFAMFDANTNNSSSPASYKIAHKKDPSTAAQAIEYNT